MGETEDTSDYTGNTVTLTYSLSAGEAGSDDSSGTLRVHKDDFYAYNINIKNTADSSQCLGTFVPSSFDGANL